MARERSAPAIFWPSSARTIESTTGDGGKYKNGGCDDNQGLNASLNARLRCGPKLGDGGIVSCDSAKLVQEERVPALPDRTHGVIIIAVLSTFRIPHTDDDASQTYIRESPV